jgi:putative tricarboxylic transport membrane protein
MKGAPMDIKKAKQDIVVMAVIMIVSALFYFSFIPGQIPMSAAWSGRTSFSSRTFPYVLAVGMFIASGVGFAKAFISYVKLKKAALAEITSTQKKTGRITLEKAIPFIIYALILVYIVLLSKIGFILSTIIMPPLMMLMLGCMKWRYYIYVYAFAAVVYVIFTVLFKIPLP